MTPRDAIKSVLDQQEDARGTNSLTDLILDSLNQSGYVVLPREPTAQMKAAGDGVIPDQIGYDNDAAGVYRAMVGAL